ncbi:MAG: carboxypeptidase-like regulatory domain-containing protein [Candidatus Thermoplasmatota archaeon]
MRGNTLPLLLTAVFLLGSIILVAPASEAQAPTSSLSGFVCSIENIYYIQAPPAEQACQNGRGLPNATVRATKPGLGGTGVGAVDKTVTADENGVFTIASIPDGDYKVTASRAGFEQKETSVTVSGSGYVELPLAGNLVTVSGKILSDTGKAIAGARVEACCSPQGSAQAETASDGTFKITITAGFRSISVSQARGFQELYEERFVDGTGSLEFKLAPVPPQDARIVGTLRDQAGRPLSGVRIEVYSYPNYDQPMPVEGDGGNGASTTTSSSAPAKSSYYYGGGSNYTVSDTNGRYEVRVYGGSSVSLSVYQDGFAPFNAYPSVGQGETKTLDIELQKYPEKTARIAGRVVDAETGKTVPFIGVNLRSPRFGLYECSREEGSPEQGQVEPAIASSDGMSISPSPYPYRDPGCTITLRSDGTFEGMVTPGYTILQVYADSYRSCSESRDADGSFSRTCGPEYLSWSRSLTLPANQTTNVLVELVSRPAPDAVVSGYLVDAKTGKAIPNAQISFSNEESYAYGYAQTDADGSYKLRLRHGYHSVSAYAEGHLSWQGNLLIVEGDQPFDVKMEPGQESYGGHGGCYGCVYATASDGKSEVAMGAPSQMASATSNSGASVREGGSGQAYEDLGGGLGPYNAAARERTLDDAARDAPSLQLLMLLGVLVIGALLRRRTA